jgi:hypothetical protein
MGELSQSFPTKRGREKFLQSLWDEDGNSKGWVEYPPDPRDQPPQIESEPSKSNRQKYARRTRRRTEH